MSKLFTGNDWEKWGKVFLAAIFILVAVIFALNFETAGLKNFLEKYEKAGLVICLLAYVLLGVTPIPSEPVTFIVLAWKGPFVAVFIATLGNTIAALVEFYIGGSLGDLADFEKKKQNLPFHLGRLPINTPLFLVLGRMLPGFGPKFVSIAAGVYQVPMFTYIWTSVVANLIGAIFIALGGTGLLKLILL